MISSDDIRVALGRATISAEEETQWQTFIDDALLLIGARLGDVTELDQARLDYVVKQAVVAYIRNPENVTQVSKSVGDVSVSQTYRSGNGPGRVTILDEWWDLLSPDEQGGRAFVVDVLGASSTHLPWCSAYFGADYCSCGVDIAGYPIYENLWA